jgi:hypothetical protein
MLFAVHYTTRPTVATKADTAALMQEFGERGEVAGTVAHYTYAGGGGFVIVEQDDMTVLYETVNAYGQWLDFDVRPILDIETAVPIILDYLSS